MSETERTAMGRTAESTRRDVIRHLDEADTDLLIWGDGFSAAMCYLGLTVARHFAKYARFAVPEQTNGSTPETAR